MQGRIHNLSRLVAAVLALAVIVASLAGKVNAQTHPRIAVWDPQAGTVETRFKLEPAELNLAATRLAEAGIHVQRLTSAQLNEPGTFSAQHFDALLLPGETFPAANVPALTRFSAEGGVLIALRTRVPFLIAIEPEANGLWTMAPKAPAFAWQKLDIMNFFGLKYNFKPELHDSGLVHEPSTLLKRYLHKADTLRQKLPSLWIYPTGDAEMYPLLGSSRADGAEVTPQIYLARKGKHTAIVISEGYATSGVSGFAPPQDVLVALVKLASDLKSGKIALEPQHRLAGLDRLSVPAPLHNRPATAEANPPGTAMVLRWGRFNGSSLELVTMCDSDLTRVLPPGKSIQLNTKTAKIAANRPVFFRVRGAFNASGAGLKVTAISGAENGVLWNELFNYIDSRSTGNFNAALSGMPTEFTRTVFIPNTVGLQSLTISNPGNAPLYMDAVQLEQAVDGGLERIIGLGAGEPTIPSEISRIWTNIRVNPRPQFVGPPGDPKRWDKMDAKMAAAVNANARIQLVLEGTPEWAAISTERMELGKAAKRPHTVPPDPQKYAILLEELIGRYGKNIDSYEIWNEPDIQQYWRGTTSEFVTLNKTLVPIIRRLAPGAPIITPGMSGYNDGWIEHMVQDGVPQAADLFAFHPYAGKSAGWDTPFGLAQGSLLSRGIGMEIFCDESGFVSRNSEWFQPPPVFTPATQARQLDVAMARLLANDLAKVSVFNAGGDGNPFGLFDAKGQPMPAYAVFADYVPLGQNGGRKLDISLTSRSGEALQGVYSAASVHSDGSVTIVVNPAEVETLQPLENPSHEFNDTAGWTTFFGKARSSDGKVTITLDEGKQYVGFYTGIKLGADPPDTLEISAPANKGGYDILLNLPDSKVITAATGQTAGNWTGNLKQLLPVGVREFELSIRLHGTTTFDYIRFKHSVPPPPQNTSIPVNLHVPLSKSAPWKATATSVGQAVPIALANSGKPGQNWADLSLAIPGRTVIRLMPQ